MADERVDEKGLKTVEDLHPKKVDTTAGKIGDKAETNEGKNGENNSENTEQLINNLQNEITKLKEDLNVISGKYDKALTENGKLFNRLTNGVTQEINPVEEIIKEYKEN